MKISSNKTRHKVNSFVASYVGLTWSGRRRLSRGAVPDLHCVAGTLWGQKGKEAFLQTPKSSISEKAMAPRSSTLAWKIPWTEGPGGLLVHGVARSRTRLSDFTLFFHFHALEKEMATHSSVGAWRIPGTGEPGGLPSMGSHRVGHDWSNLAAAAVSILALWPTNRDSGKIPNLFGPRFLYI